MKKILTALMLFVAFTSCDAQKKKPLIKKEHYCNRDSVNKWFEKKEVGNFMIDVGYFSSYEHNGIMYQDTTGLAKYKRRKPIEDTTYFETTYDTSSVELYVKASAGNMERLSVLKSRSRDIIWRRGRYIDPLTREIILASGAMGTTTYETFSYLSLSKEPLPKSIKIIAEIKN